MKRFEPRLAEVTRTDGNLRDAVTLTEKAHSGALQKVRGHLNRGGLFLFVQPLPKQRRLVPALTVYRHNNACSELRVFSPRARTIYTVSSGTFY